MLQKGFFFSSAWTLTWFPAADGGLFLGGEGAAALFWNPGGPAAQPEVSNNPIWVDFARSGRAVARGYALLQFK